MKLFCCLLVKVCLVWRYASFIWSTYLSSLYSICSEGEGASNGCIAHVFKILNKSFISLLFLPSVAHRVKLTPCSAWPRLYIFMNFLMRSLKRAFISRCAKQLIHFYLIPINFSDPGAMLQWQFISLDLFEFNQHQIINNNCNLILNKIQWTRICSARVLSVCLVSNSLKLAPLGHKTNPPRPAFKWVYFGCHYKFISNRYLHFGAFYWLSIYYYIIIIMGRKNCVAQKQRDNHIFAVWGCFCWHFCGT